MTVTTHNKSLTVANYILNLSKNNRWEGKSVIEVRLNIITNSDETYCVIATTDDYESITSVWLTPAQVKEMATVFGYLDQLLVERGVE